MGDQELLTERKIVENHVTPTKLYHLSLFQILLTMREPTWLKNASKRIYGINGLTVSTGDIMMLYIKFGGKHRFTPHWSYVVYVMHRSPRDTLVFPMVPLRFSTHSIWCIPVPQALGNWLWYWRRCYLIRRLLAQEKCCYWFGKQSCWE